MQVLGDLLILPKNSTIPLPWWHRAPLGLVHDTTVHVALTQPGDRPIGDLIVSVVDCGKWPWMFQVQCQHQEQPGVLARAFSAISPLNIALAEAATILTGTKTPSGDLTRRHDLTLICEPPGSVALKDPGMLMDKDIESRLKEGGFQPVVIDSADLPPLLWTAVGRVNHGWVDNVDWRSEGIKEYFSPDMRKRVDLGRAVVSVDTDQRVLRFVFPYKGAKTIAIEHRDEPGILAKLTKTITACGLNILSAFLRRGGVERDNALLVAVCEPVTHDSRTAGLDKELRQKLRNLPHWYRVRPRIDQGIKAEGTIYPKHPDDVVASVPERLRDTVRIYRTSFSEGKKKPVFVSRRFIERNSKVDAIVTAVHDSLKRNHCHAVEASLKAEETPRTPDEVEATMWACHAAIVLVAGGGEASDTDVFGTNLAHEYGFFRGQGKPVLLLIEKGYMKALEKWTNSLGLNAPHFASGPEGFDPANHSSIHKIVSDWIKSWMRRVG